MPGGSTTRTAVVGTGVAVLALGPLAGSALAGGVDSDVSVPVTVSPSTSVSDVLDVADVVDVAVSDVL